MENFEISGHSEHLRRRAEHLRARAKALDGHRLSRRDRTSNMASGDRITDVWRLVNAEAAMYAPAAPWSSWHTPHQYLNAVSSGPTLILDSARRPRRRDRHHKRRCAGVLSL